MKQQKSLDANEKKKIEFLLSSLVVGVMLLACLLSWFDPLESLLLNQRFYLRGEKALPENVVLVGIDEKSLDHPESGPWPWSRGIFAQFLYEIYSSQSKPRVVGIEMLFENKSLSDEPGDDALVFRTGQVPGRVVTGYFMEQGYRSRFDRNLQSEKRLQQFVLTNIESRPKKIENFSKVSLPFFDLTQNVELGFLNLSDRAAGGMHRLKLIGSYRGNIYPSFQLMIALRYWGLSERNVVVKKNKIIINHSDGKKQTIPMTPEGDMWINYYGKYRDRAMQNLSFIHVLQGADMLSPAQVRKMMSGMEGKVVLVGQSAVSIKESHATPFDKQLSGLALRSQGIANLLDQSYLRRAPKWIAVLWLLFLSLFSFLVTNRFSIAKACLWVGCASIVYFTLSQILFSSGYWLEIIIQLLSMFAVFILVSGFRYFTALEELRNTQLQLIHSAKMATIGHVSANMAHEFRNIMHAIKLHVEACTRKGVKPERVEKYMGVIFKTMTNAELILNGILTFSRKNESDRKMGELDKTIKDTMLLLKREFEYQNISVSLQLEDVKPFAFDAGQISQVIMNLLNNSRDALKDQKEKIIIIKLKEDERNIYLDIADNGPGIPDEVLKNLFQSFVTTKEEGKGTGLGLSVCQKIIQNHQGTIIPKTVRGQGTVWHLVFPKEDSLG